jgi:AcrR family transcriptional regulator
MAYRRTASVQARLDEQHGRLLAAATAQLAEHGYGGCSIAAVAQRAGVAAGTVYNHFTDKAELVAEVFRTVVSGEVAAVRTAVGNADDTAARLNAFVLTFAGRALKSPRLAYALLVEPVDAGVDELRLEFRVAFRDIARAVIRTGVAAGELPAQDDGVVAAALVGAIGEALVGPLSGAPDLDTAATLVEFASRSIGVRHAVHA